MTGSAELEAQASAIAAHKARLDEIDLELRRRQIAVLVRDGGPPCQGRLDQVGVELDAAEAALLAGDLDKCELHRGFAQIWIRITELCIQAHQAALA